MAVAVVLFLWERAAVVDVTGLLRRGSLAEAAASRKSKAVVWRMMVEVGGPGFSRDETSFAVVAFLCFVGRSKSIAFAQWLLSFGCPEEVPQFFWFQVVIDFIMQ